MSGLGLILNEKHCFDKLDYFQITDFMKLSFQNEVSSVMRYLNNK